MIIKFENFKLITENPDTIPMGGFKALHYYDEDAIPFDVKVNSNHTQAENIFLGKASYCHNSVECFGDKDKAYPGRIWTKHKMISFWIYPNEKLFVSIIKKLEEKLGIDIFNNDWKINIMKIDNKIEKEEFDSSKEQDYFNRSTVGKEDIISVEEYAGSENAPEDLRALHMMNWKEKALAKKQGKIHYKGWGSDKTAWDQPHNIQCRQKMYQEKKNNNNDN